MERLIERSILLKIRGTFENIPMNAKPLLQILGDYFTNNHANVGVISIVEGLSTI